MSVAKLLLSGFLVASGLILGAFTLHAYFAPRSKIQATVAATPEREPRPTEAPRERAPVAVGAVPDNWAAQLVKTEPDAKAAADTEAAKAKKRLAEKKAAEKRQKTDKTKEEEESPTVFSWLAGLFNNN